MRVRIYTADGRYQETLVDDDNFERFVQNLLDNHVFDYFFFTNTADQEVCIPYNRITCISKIKTKGEND